MFEELIEKFRNRLIPDLNEGLDLSQGSVMDLYLQEDLSKSLPYSVYESSSQLYYNDQSVGFVCEGVPFVGLGETTQRQLMGLFQHTLPEGASLQFHLFASSHIDPLLRAWKKARTHKNALHQKIVEARVSAFQKAQDLSVPHRNFRLLISVSLPKSVFESLGLGPMKEVKKQIISSFEGLGMPLRNLDPQDLISYVHEFFGKSHKVQETYNPLEKISHQVLPHGVRYDVLPDRLAIDGGAEFMESYTVKKFPPHWELPFMEGMIGDGISDFLQIPSAFMLHYGITLNGEGANRREVLRKQKLNDYQAGVPNLRKSIPSLEFQIAEWEFVRAKFEEGHRLLKTRFQVILMGPEHLRIQSQQRLMGLFRAQRWSLEKDTFIQLPSLISALPMMWGEGGSSDSQFFSKAKTTLSYEPANLLPILGEWKGTPNPLMLFAGRRGQVFTWNPFDNMAGNYNVCVVGRSGSGKSVFMQELITSVLGSGGRVTVLDVGRSFEKTIKLLGGEFVEFSTHSPLCINPFSSMPAGDPEAVSDALGMLKPIISLMAAPQGGTNDLENSFIEKAIMHVWEDKQHQATITDVANDLLTSNDPVAKTLGDMLYPYTEKGIYGRFFNGKSTIDLSNPAIVFELEELKERKDLQAVIVQMIILQVTNHIYLGDRKTPSCLVLDEAWDLLRGKQSGLFVETAARRLRKYKGALVTGTQSVNDFYATPGAQAAFENSDWMCLLSQKSESIDLLTKSGRLSLGGGEELLKTVHTKQGHYAEVMIAGPDGYAVGRLHLDPFSQMLYSTKAEDYAAALDLMADGLSLEDAITRLAARP